jgi:glycosyltransferase involved in cell wall biosynthesis
MYPPHHYGGYELVWRSAVEHLRSRGHEARVLTTDTRIATAEPDGPDVHRELRWHLRDGEFESLAWPSVIAMTRHNHTILERHVREFQPDVVTWWSMGGLSLTLLEAVRRRSIPAVAFVHDEWLDYGRRVDPWLHRFTGPRRSRLAPLAERLLGVPARVDLAAAARYVFVSEFTRRQAIDAGVELMDTAVAHSGIHPDFIDPAPEHVWRWRLLYVGRIDRRKGVDTAVEALTHLPPEARLTVVGGWDEGAEADLAAVAEDIGVRDRVTFAGQREREQVADAYGEADAVLFPVRWGEPWGLVPLEAMARGRPVVATGRGGSGEYLRNGENCVLFEADDATALAAAVKLLASDAGLRHRLCEHGLRTAELHTELVFNAAVERAVLDAAGHSRVPVRGPAVEA